jgi:hypothetical protein
MAQSAIRTGGAAPLHRGLGPVVSESDRPLFLIVCADAAGMAAARALVREAGGLPVASRSIPAALSLLSQVRVDCCLLCDPAPPELAGELWDQLERYRPGCPRLYSADAQPAPLDRWSACDESDLSAAIRRAVQAVLP